MKANIDWASITVPDYSVVMGVHRDENGKFCSALIKREIMTGQGRRAYFKAEQARRAWWKQKLNQRRASYWRKQVLKWDAKIQ